MRVFITGTDTDIGKTLISAWLCAQLKATYYKPIQCGLPADADTVAALSGQSVWPSNYSFNQAVSPHLAAEQSGTIISLSAITPPSIKDTPACVGEGAGGVLVPINPSGDTLLTIMRQLNWPVIVVARSTLGTINHTCLTIQALKGAGLSVLGVVLNGPPNPHNVAAIEYYGKVPILAQVPLLHSEPPAPCFPATTATSPLKNKPADLPPSNLALAQWVQQTPLPAALKNAMQLPATC